MNCPKCGNVKTNINVDRGLGYCGRCGHEWVYKAEPAIALIVADSRCPMCQGPTYFKKVCPACDNDPRN